MPFRIWMLVIGVLAFAGIWQWLALGDAITAENLRHLLERLAAAGGSAWAPVLLIAAYVAGSLVVFPLGLFVLATGLIFGPWLGFGYALVGTMCAAAGTYWVGRAAGRHAVLRYGGRRANRIADALSRRGTAASFALAFLPLAPFTLTNMAAGAMRIALPHFLIGTVIGVAPGLLALTVVGSQLRTLAFGDRAAWLWIGGAAAAFVLLVLLSRRAVGGWLAGDER